MLMRERAWDSDVLHSVLSDIFSDLGNLCLDLHPLHLSEVRSTFKDLSRSSGNCYCHKCKRKTDIDDWELNQCIHDLKHDLNNIPDFKVSFRSQVRKRQAKRRIIFVAPGPFVMVEKMFWAPLQESMSQSSAISWWNVGFDWFKSGGMKFAPYLNQKDVFSTDFSDFDFCPPPQLIRQIMKKIGELFEMSPEQLKIWHGITEVYVKRWINYRGERLLNYGGIASGVAGTNIIGSIIGKVVINYTLAKMGFQSPIDSQHYGDDCFVRLQCSLQHLIEGVSKYTSFTLSSDKSKFGVYWLGFKWSHDRWVLQDRDKRWAQLFLPEQKHSFVSRLQAMLLNCLSDPIRLELISILTDWDELSLRPEVIEMLGLEDLDPNMAKLPVDELELIFKRNHAL